MQKNKKKWFELTCEITGEYVIGSNGKRQTGPCFGDTLEAELVIRHFEWTPGKKRRGEQRNEECAKGHCVSDNIHCTISFLITSAEFGETNLARWPTYISL